jgi:hypothetical protein
MKSFKHEKIQEGSLERERTGTMYLCREPQSAVLKERSVALSSRCPVMESAT